MSLALFHDTIVAPSTPEGKSALAIVRLSGHDAIRIASSLVRDPEPILTLLGGASTHVNVLAQDGRVLDDVVITVFRAPRSYTGEDLVEIACHGSAVLVSSLVQLLTARGARLAEPGEFSRRAFIHGKTDIEALELVSARVEARSDAELRGTEIAIREKLARLRRVYDAILELIALVDAQIDFGETDDVIVPELPQKVSSVLDVLRGLLAESSTRRVNSGTFTVALTGPPNVGKSSLFNALLRFERSIVSPIPGTTRDYVEAFLEIEGVRVKLVDTAGVRLAEESTEQKGIEMGQDVSRRADVVFRLTAPEDRNPSVEPDVVLLHNKSDVDDWQEGLSVSAISGAGLDRLHEWVASRVRRANREFSAVRLSEVEEDTIRDVVESLIGLYAFDDLVLVAEQLRSALFRIGALLGVNVGEDSLNYIFSRMCIGK